MASWWAAPRSIPKAGRNLCRPALPRYFPGRMYSFLLILLTLDALILTTAVLLQAGQGGGLASLGGGAGTEQFMGGRQAPTFLTPSLSGYEEVFTDPSYLGQIVVMTAPMIGNYGINPDDIESDRPRVAGVVVRELSVQPSNWRSTGALAEWLAAARIPLVADVDTRQITRHIRSKGAMRGAVAIGEQPNDAVRTALAASPSMDGLDLATEATIGAEYSAGPADARRHKIGRAHV